MTQNTYSKIQAIVLAALMVGSIFAVASPAAAAVTTGDRSVPGSISPGGTATVTVTANMDGAGGALSLNEAFSGDVQSASIQSVTVDGSSVSPFLATADPNGAVVTLTSTGANSVVEIEYTITATGAASGDITIDGDLTGGPNTADLGTDSIAVSGTGGGPSVVFPDQPSRGDSLTFDSVSTASSGTHIAIWSTNDTGAPDALVASKNVGTGYQSSNEIFSGLGISDSDEYIGAVHSGSPAVGNVIASDTAQVTVVEADVFDSSPGDAPTYWQGQVVILQSAGGQSFTPGQEYQVRSMSKEGGPDGQQWEVDPGPIQEIRATGNGELIVRSEFMPADAYAVESNANPLAPGDTPGSANSLDGVPNYAFEVAVQDLDIEIRPGETGTPSVVNGNDVPVEVQSNRAGYAVNVYWNETNRTLVDSFSNLGNFEEVDVDVGVWGAWNGNTEDLIFEVTDTTASDAEPLEVLPAPSEAIVRSGASFTQSSFSEETGDIAEVSVDFTESYSDYGEGTRFRTWVMVGSAGDRIIDLVNITDYDQDGSATFTMNSFELGRNDPTGVTTPGDAYAPVSADNISVTRPRHYSNVPGFMTIAGPAGSEMVWGHETGQLDTPDFETPPRTGINNPLGATSYSLQSMSAPLINLSADENNMVIPAFSDAASLVLSERSLQDDVGVWVAPQGTESNMVNRSTILAEATKLNDDGAIHSDVVANGDTVVLGFHASGFEGHVANIGDILGPNGIHTFVAQSNVPADGDRYYWDLARHGSLIADSENDTYYVVVPTSRLTGVGTLDNEPPRNTMYEANMVIAGGQTINRSDFAGSVWTGATSGTFADFYEEGEFPDDSNFADTYNNEDFEWDLDDYDSVWHPQPWFTQQEQEHAETSMVLSQRVAEFDQYVENVSELRMNANAEELVSGETNLAPGSSFRVSLQNTSAAFNRNVDVTVELEDGQRVWNTTFDLSDEAGTPFLAQVLEAGVSITTSAQATIDTAQGPAVPGLVTERPMASVTMDDQIARDAGTLVTVHDVSMNKGGFLAIHQGSASGPVVGVSRYLSAGNYSNVNVRLEEAVTGTATLVAMPHIDTNDNHVYDWLANKNLDGPFVVDGSIVTDAASVQIPTPTPTTTTPTPTTTTPTPTTTTPTPTTTTPTPTTTTPTDEPTTTTTTEGDGPGFGIIVALVALVAAALLAVRRER